MTQLDMLTGWLMTYPGWEGTLCVDVTERVPGGTGLYPKGLQELSRREDVSGGLTVRYRWNFTLHRVAAKTPEENARWLLEFQQWVARQSLLGKAPVFGDEPRTECLRAGDGTLIDRKPGGSTQYSVQLSVDFTKIFRGE